MRMNAFIIGGFLGAAAALYFANRQMIMAKTGNMGQAVNGIMNKAKDKMIEAVLSPALGDSSATASSPSTISPSQANPTNVAAAMQVAAQSQSTYGVNDKGTQQQIKDLINKNASVKREVDAILKENQTSL